MSWRAFTALLLLCLVSACGDVDETAPVSAALGRSIHDGGALQVNLVNMTRFDWDELYLFAPYTSPGEICHQLALADKDCRELLPVESVDDTTMPMIFKLRGQVVHGELHKRLNGDFLPLDFDQPVTERRAGFIVVRSGKTVEGERWVQLRPLSADGSTTP
jgi:hypothetical protein